ncbi:MAG: hypothetical protein D6815_11990 [Candidatus Dadabacteria bacterium]|nr:MAG: hypothetical protein D6815_11990 [Candidatus Dadabacteria bacterium]
MVTKNERSRAAGRANRWNTLVAGIAVLFVATGSAAPAAELKRPHYQVRRFEEDWSVLAEVPAAERTGRFDAMKYVRLTEDGWLWASFGAQVRERIEAWSNFGFGAPADADAVFLLSRMFAHADFHLGPAARLFIEAKSSLATDRDITGGRRTLDVDELDLQNGFAELRVPLADEGRMTLRVGREELLFGKQRLVSPLDWSNTRRTFDGITARFEAFGWSATGFFSQLVRVKKYDPNTTNDDVDLFGLYATTSELRGLGGADLYWLGLDRTSAAFNGDSGHERRHTVGARLWGSIGEKRIDYDLEAAYQFGDLGSADVSAFMIASQAGTSIAALGYHPRVEVGFDYASGDDEPGDGDVETFNQLYPLGHAYLGYIDLVGRQNIIDLRGTTVWPFFLRSKIKVDLHSFWRASTDDGLYNAGGKLLRAGSAGDSRHVGIELDMTVKRPVSPHTLVVLGYHHFFPGDFVEQSGRSRDVDFAYLSVQYTI